MGLRPVAGETLKPGVTSWLGFFLFFSVLSTMVRVLLIQNPGKHRLKKWYLCAQGSGVGGQGRASMW